MGGNYILTSVDVDDDLRVLMLLQGIDDIVILLGIHLAQQTLDVG